MKNKGMTLIEVLISLFLLTVGIIGTFVILQKIINYGSLISSRFIASYLAEEGIEIVRNIRDDYWLDESKTWVNFKDDGRDCCLSGCELDYQNSGFNNCSLGEDYGSYRYVKIDNNSGFYKYANEGTPTNFKRKINIEQVGNDQVKVVVEVIWDQSGQNYQIKVQENLYNWWRE